MNRILILLALCVLAQTARAQVSTDEAYRRLRERQEAERRAAASQPATKPATLPSGLNASTARGPQATASSDGLVDFEDANLGVRLKRPATWKEGKPGGKGNSVAFVDASPVGKDRYADSFSVGVQNFPLKESIEVIETQINAALAKATTQFKVISDEAIQVAGHPGRKLVYTGHPANSADPRDHQFVQAITLINGKLYIFTYATLPERYEKAAPTISKILNSFEVIDPLDQLIKPSSSDATTAAGKKPMSASASGLVDYTDPKLGFSIKRPAKWLQPKVNLNYVVIFLESLNGARITRGGSGATPSSPPAAVPGFSASLNIVVQPVAARKTLDAAVDSNKSMIHEAVNPFNMVSDDKIQLGDQPARKLIYTGQDVKSKTEVQTVEAIVIANGKQYTITYITLPERYQKESPMISEILDSLQFTSK